MSNLSKPLYALSIEEYIELSKRLIADEINLALQNGEEKNSTPNIQQDVIFLEEALSITGYKKSTLYSKVCRFEIPVLSRRKPLTFSRKAILQWMKDGKPCSISQEANNHINTKLC